MSDVSKLAQFCKPFLAHTVPIFRTYILHRKGVKGGGALVGGEAAVVA